MASLTPLCADTARERGDPMPGTALHVNRFLLVEHPGPWAFDALDAVGPDIREQLVAATRATGSRTLLIRRHGRIPVAHEWAWAVADVTAGRIRWGTYREDADLLAARDALSEPSEGWSDEPAVLVCTHGRHDTCCAIRGRPVAEALSRRLGDAVWECSHVGGDRFAPSVVVLPDGTYYGGLDPTNANDVVEQHLAGTVTPHRLRGSCLLPPVAQAAAIAAHERFGPGGPRDLRSSAIETLGPGRWRVELHGTDPFPARVVASVEARQAAPAVLTCQADRATSARTFVVTDLQAAGSASGSSAPAG
jgi:(2Fe-2S) ferredoxin